MAPPLCEVRVFSRRHRYAGTLDVLGRWPAAPFGLLIDYKTGDPEDVAADLQTAAYERALLEMRANGDTSDQIVFDELTHTYTMEGERWPSVTGVLQRAGLIDFSDIPGPIMAAALDRGSAVHRAIHYYNENALDVDDFARTFPAYWPYVCAWLSFLDDSKFEVATVDQLDTLTHIQRFAVRLMKTGKYAVETYGNPRDHRDFLALLTAQQIVDRRRPYTHVMVA
jgi:hypothetical protein